MSERLGDTAILDAEPLLALALTVGEELVRGQPCQHRGQGHRLCARPGSRKVGTDCRPWPGAHTVAAARTRCEDL